MTAERLEEIREHARRPIMRETSDMIFELCKRVEELENIAWYLRKDVQSIRFTADVILGSCDQVHPRENAKKDGR